MASQFGGIPVDSVPPQAGGSQFGGIPVDVSPAPQGTPNPFTQQFDSATNAGANLIRPFIGQAQQNNTPDMDALKAQGWSGITTPQKFGAVEEALMSSPPGQMASAVGGTVMNLPSMLMGKLNQGLEAVGLPHQYAQAAEMALPLVAKGAPVAEAAETPRVPPVLDSTAAPTAPVTGAPTVAPGAPLIDAMTTDAGKPLQITPKGLDQAHTDLPAYLSADGIDLNKVADDLEAARKVNPDVRAIDVMTRDQDGLPSGQNMMSLAKTIAQTPGEGRTLAGQMLARNAGANDRIATAFDNSLSNADYYQGADQLGKQMKAAGTAYTKAYNNPVGMDSPEINELLARPAGLKALANAKTLAANEGATITTPDGALNTQGIDYVKRALDDMVQGQGTNQFGKQTQEGKSFTGLKNGILSEADRLNPDFAAARANFSTPAQQMEYLQDGRGFMNMDHEEISRLFNNPSIPAANKTQFLAGARRELQDKLDLKGDTNAINTLWKPPLQKKIRAMMPDQKAYDAFAAYMEHEKNMARVNGKLVGGSDTLEKTEFNKAPVKSAVGNVIRAASGLPEFVGGKIADLADAKLASQAKAMSQESKAAIARYYTTKDPQLLRNLANQINKPSKGIQFPDPRPLARQIGNAAPVIGAGGAAESASAMDEARNRLGNPGPQAIPPVQVGHAAAQLPTSALTRKFAQAESGGNPDARNPNSSASGLMQFTNPTWGYLVNKYGKDAGITLADKNNPQAQATMASLYAKENIPTLQKALGRMPGMGDLYAAHFLGASGAAKLIQAQGTGEAASKVLPKAASSNPKIFFNGNRPRTVEEVYSLLNRKVSG